MPAGVLSLLRRLPPLLPEWRQRRRTRAAQREPVAEAPAAAEASPAAPAVARAPSTPVPPEAVQEASLGWADKLWGDGCGMPGGAAEVLRLVNLMPVSPATTVLIVANDTGGAGQAVAAARGAWVAVHIDQPALQERAALRLQTLGRRASVLGWLPREPLFRHRYHHHALALEGLRRSPPDRLLRALAGGLKPGGQLVMADVVRPSAGPVPPPLARWCQLEDRATPPPLGTEVEAALEAAGFQVHVAEDAGARHRRALVEAWARVIEEMQKGERPPTRAASLALVAEAERWLLREKLMEAGLLRVMRWHATLAKDPPATMAW